jgi:hypothetical protein
VKCCSKCREVANAQSKKYREDHADQFSEKMKKYQKRYYENNTDQISEKKKKYREKNADQISEQKRKYYKNNTEKFSEYYKNNAEQICERAKIYYDDQKISNPLHLKFIRMIHSSIKSDTKYNRLYDPQDYIDKEFLNYVWNDQTQQCYHCNCEMTLDFSVTTRSPTQISIQRLNNDLPHLKLNCVLACLSCNLKRKELTKVEHQE